LQAYANACSNCFAVILKKIVVKLYLIFFSCVNYRGGAIQFFGTKRHHDKWLKDTENYLVKGCFAMTELGHGSNVCGVYQITWIYTADLHCFISLSNMSCLTMYLPSISRYEELRQLPHTTQELENLLSTLLVNQLKSTGLVVLLMYDSFLLFMSFNLLPVR